MSLMSRELSKALDLERHRHLHLDETAYGPRSAVRAGELDGALATQRSPRQRERARLVGPYALIGILVACGYLDAFGGCLAGRDPTPIPIVLVLTPVVAGGFGVVLDRRARATAYGHSLALAGVLTVVAGSVNGMACGVLAMFAGFLRWHLGEGLAGGAIFGAFAARRSWRAR